MVGVLVLMMALVFTLSGCRYSDTLLQVIIDPDTGILDDKATPEYMEKENAPLNPDLASIYLSENENLADQLNSLPVYREDAPVNGQAVRRTYEEMTPDEVDASEGNEMPDTEEENTSTSDQTSDTESDSASSSDEQASEEEQTSDQGDQSQADKTSGRGGTGQVYGDGNYDELPDARCVAAKGIYALITQMLAGKGGLDAADATWINQMQSKGIFPNEGLEELKVAWRADGSLDIDALIASDADTIFVDGVDTVLSTDQESALTQAGFNIVHVPALGNTYTSDADIVTAIKVVGQVLSGLNAQSAYDAAAMAQNYIEVHDEVINACVEANGGYSYKFVYGQDYQYIYQGTGEETSNLCTSRISTACVDSWTSGSGTSMVANRTWNFHDLYLNGQTIDLSNGVGLSASTVGGRFILSDYYLQTAGIINNAYDVAKPVSGNGATDQSLPFAITPGSSEGVTARQVANRVAPSALWYPESRNDFFGIWHTVGDPDFPGVIACNATIAQNIAASAAKVNGLYNVGQPYKIYQIPTGIAGNWFDGNPESFLTSYWSLCMLRQGDSAATEEIRKLIDDYYRAFYRISENGSQQLEGFGAVTTALCPRG